MALADFKERVRAYEAVYEELADEEDDGGISYIKVRTFACLSRSCMIVRLRLASMH